MAFNYFYVAIQYNPVDISNQLRKNNGTIPGIRPGKPTSDFITKTLSKITLIGAVFLAIVAAVPMIIGDLTGVSIQLVVPACSLSSAWHWIRPVLWKAT